MSTPAATNIYDSIGGEPALAAVVDDLYQRVTADPTALIFEVIGHGVRFSGNGYDLAACWSRRRDGVRRSLK